MKVKNEINVVKMYKDNKLSKEIVTIITGSTSGIGKELAMQLFSLGEATIIIASRSEEKCRDTIREIQNSASDQIMNRY